MPMQNVALRCGIITVHVDIGTLAGRAVLLRRRVGCLLVTPCLIRCIPTLFQTAKSLGDEASPLRTQATSLDLTQLAEGAL